MRRHGRVAAFARPCDVGDCAGRTYYCTLSRGGRLGPEKAASNIGKHGVRFAEAALVFEDPAAITATDDESDPSERRFVTLGVDAAGRIPVVVYTWCGDDMRLISARRAEPHEREEYHEQ